MKMQDLIGVIFNTKEDKQYIQACLVTASLSKQDEYKLVGLIHNGSKKEREFATDTRYCTY